MTAVLPPTTSTTCTEHLRLIHGVHSVVTEDGELCLVAGLRSASFGRATQWKREVLDRLARDLSSLPQLSETAEMASTVTKAAELTKATKATEPAMPAEPTKPTKPAEPTMPAKMPAVAGTEPTPGEPPDQDLRRFVGLLRAGGWLSRTIGWAGTELYTVRPCNGPTRPVGPVPDDVPNTEITLSRFTVVHRDDDRMVLEHPLAGVRIELHDTRLLAVIGQLARPIAWSSVHGPFPEEVLICLLGDLYRAGLVVSSPAAEDTELSGRQWEAHELWFHRRSRISHPGSAVTPYGRTHWAKGIFDPVPARRDPYPGPAIELDTPDLGELRRMDPTLTTVMEERRSVRVYDDDDPITVGELGELFYRCARIRRSFTADGVEYLSAPYPSGGSVYELEFYPVVRVAAGIDPGMYHYDAHRHQLRQVREMGPDVARLLASARAGTFERSLAQVLVVISARFGRLMWTYQEMPYSLILKHVGVVYQTVYLTATAMGLAACAIGGGDGTAFTEATGLDYTSESSVGEFMLGRGLAD